MPSHRPNDTSNPAIEELAALDRWVTWQPERGKSGKTSKIPYDAKTGYRASSTNPKTWATYAEARKAGKTLIGFVVTGDDPYVCVDLDNSYHPDTGELSDTARKIVTLLDSYTEISPSYHGIKIWIRGSLPSTLKRSTPPPVEAYATDRYLCVTGQHLPGTPVGIEDRQAALDALVAEYRQEEPKRGKRSERTKERSEPRKRGTGAAAESVGLLKEALKLHGFGYRERPAGEGDKYETKLVLVDVCLTSTEHEDGAAILIYPDGGRSYKYHHASCADKTWADAAPTIGLDPQHYGTAETRIEYLTTDTANGRRLVARHGEKLRYAPGLGWLVYDGKRWVRDEQGRVFEFAKETALGLFDEAKDAAEGGTRA